MKILIEDNDTDVLLFKTEDTSIVPNEGETLIINSKMYSVIVRVFEYSITSDNECTLRVKELRKK